MRRLEVFDARMTSTRSWTMAVVPTIVYAVSTTLGLSRPCLAAEPGAVTLNIAPSRLIDLERVDPALGPTIVGPAASNQASLLLLGILTSLAVLAAGLGWWLRVRRAPHHAQRVLDSLPSAIAVFDARGKLTALNTQLQRCLRQRIDPSQLSGITPERLYARLSPCPEQIRTAREQAREATLDPDATLDFDLPGHDEQRFAIRERAIHGGGLAISVHELALAAPDHLNDATTELPGRLRLVVDLARRCRLRRFDFALVLIDLRGFREINDRYGRQRGDDLLRQAAIALADALPEDAQLYRTGGDEFSVVLDRLGTRQILTDSLAGFAATLEQGLGEASDRVMTSAAMGIAFAPEHGRSVSTLMQSADSACAQAKRAASGADSAEAVIFNPVQRRRAKRRHLLEIGLHQAIDTDQLSLAYQPQIDTRSQLTYGMEALLRWDHPRFGRIAPSDFIPIAEQNGRINVIGLWVLRRAIADYQRLARFGLSPGMLAVNLSRRQFDRRPIVTEIGDVLEETGFDPEKLCLEITETSLFRDSERLQRDLVALTRFGCRLAIDDFGVGYSSLRELRDFPIHEIKIDRAFVDDVVDNRRNQDIIGAVVSIGASIGADVVAEGIENREQLATVSELGCERAQGYYLCEPMNATGFPDVVLSV